MNKAVAMKAHEEADKREQFESQLRVFYEHVLERSSLKNPDVLLPLGFIFLSCFLLREMAKGKKGMKTLAMALVLLDLWRWDMHLMPKDDIYQVKPRGVPIGRDKKAILAEDEVTSLLRKQQGLFRFWASDNLYPANKGILFDLHNANGYDPIILREYGEFMNLIHQKPLEEFPSQAFYEEGGYGKDHFTSKLFDLLNVRFFLTDQEIKDENFEVIFEKSIRDGHGRERFLKVYEKKPYLPRAFVVHDFISVPNKEAVAEELLKPSFEPDKMVILSDAKELLPQKRPPEVTLSGNSHAEITFYSPNRIEVRAELGGDGFLVLSETFYPGWKAYEGGKEIDILRADYLLRAIPLSRGQHQVVFAFKPWSFYWGLLITLLTLSFFIVWNVKSFKENLRPSFSLKDER